MWVAGQEVIRFEKSRNYFKRRGELLSVNDCWVLGNRLVIPKSLRGDVLVLLHKNHSGIVLSKILARSYIWWPNIDVELEQFIKTCIERQCNQNDKTTKEKVYIPWGNSSESWNRLHMNFLEINQDKVLLIVDSYSKLIEGIAVSSTTASRVIEISDEFFSRFGSH